MNNLLRRLGWLSAATTVTLSLFGCGGSVEGSGGTGGSTTTTGGATGVDPVEALSAACGAMNGGGSADPITAACTRLVHVRNGFSTTCSAWGEPVLDDEATIATCVGIATAAGVTVTAGDIASCSAEVCAAGCQTGGLPSCVGNAQELLFPGFQKKGTLTAGEGCFTHLQCQSGVCSSGADGCGQCLTTKQAGEDCSGPLDVCVGYTVSCANGVCEPSGKKEGEACISYGGGDCQSTLFCETPDPQSIDGTCVPRAKSGQACSAQDECAAGLFCKAGSCTGYLPDGAACGPDDLCASSYCVNGACGIPQMGLHVGDDCSAAMVCRDGLECDQGVCIPMKYVPEGAECDLGGAGFCAPDQICDNPSCPLGPCVEPLHCLPAPGEGEPCGSYLQCAEGHACVGYSFEDGERGTCAKLGGLFEVPALATKTSSVARGAASRGAIPCAREAKSEPASQPEEPRRARRVVARLHRRRLPARAQAAPRRSHVPGGAPRSVEGRLQAQPPGSSAPPEAPSQPSST